MTVSLQQQTGFNLIELMIVVAIIAILAAIAIPSYTHYTDKAKFTEVIQAVAPFKLAVETCAYTQSDIQRCVHAAGQDEGQTDIPPPLQNTDPDKGYVKSIIVRSGGANTVQIVATSQNIGGSAKNYVYILDAIRENNGQLKWLKDVQSTCSAAGLC